LGIGGVGEIVDVNSKLLGFGDRFAGDKAGGVHEGLLVSQKRLESGRKLL